MESWQLHLFDWFTNYFAKLYMETVILVSAQKNY